MAKNISDANGRALEYCIVDYLIQHSANLHPIGSTLVDQSRDKLKFSALHSSLKLSYPIVARKIANWLNDNHSIYNNRYTIERLPDDAAKKGDVTDIRIILDNGEVENLSIKHNHEAIKHQRPPSTANQLGFAKKSREDLNHRNNLKKVLDSFHDKANSDLPSAKLFCELKKIDAEYINDNLYEPVINVVANTIQKHCVNQAPVENYFKFLLGRTDYNKLIVRGTNVTIHQFENLAIPTSVIVTLSGKSYINLEFSNGYKVSMRIHTASSRLGNSLKFDSKLNMEVSKIVPTTYL